MTARTMTDRATSLNHATAATRGLVIGEDGLARPEWASQDPLLRNYYDHEWGVPVTDETGLFERLSLEAFQSGLSWATILKKRPAFREAFANFNPEVVANFDDTDRDRLLADTRIVRNRAKIDATINNAQATLQLRDSGGLAALVWSFQPDSWTPPQSVSEIPTTSPESHALAKTLKKKGFKFVGPTTVLALMEAVGIVDTRVEGAHRPEGT